MLVVSGCHNPPIRIERTACRNEDASGLLFTDLSKITKIKQNRAGTNNHWPNGKFIVERCQSFRRCHLIRALLLDWSHTIYSCNVFYVRRSWNFGNSRCNLLIPFYTAAALLQLV